MILTVKHGFVSAVADDPNAAALGEILPQAHWNAAHIVTGTLDPTQVPLIQSFNASGSAQSTTGTISAGSTTLSLGAAQDFQNGQGINIYGAGPTATVQQPTGLTLVTSGAAGTTSHTYQLASVDAFGGVGVAIAGVTITTANATLNLNAYVVLSWTAPAAGPAPAAYVIYRDGVFIGLTAQTIFNDQGVVRSTPSWCPATPPGAATADMLVTSIVSGAGSTSLILAVGALNTVTGATVQHDDTTALTNALTAAMGSRQLYVPSGTYLITSEINIPITGNVDIVCEDAAIFKANTNVATVLINYRDNVGSNRFGFSMKGGTIDNSQGIFGVAAATDSCIGFTRVGPLFFDGVTFQGASSLDQAGVTTDSGIQFVTANNVIVTNCLFLGQGDLGIYGSGGPSFGGADDAGDCVISNNIFVNCGGAVSIKRQMPRTIISNNVVDTCVFGFSLFEAASAPNVIDPGRQCIISNNIIRRVTSTGVCIHAGAADTADGSGTGITSGSRTQIIGNTILDWGYLSDGVTPYNGSTSLGGTPAAITIQGASQCRISDNILALEDWTQGGNGASTQKGIYITQFVLNSITYNPDSVVIDGCDLTNIHNGIYEDPAATGIGPTMAWGCTFRNVTNHITVTNTNSTLQEWDITNKAIRTFVGGISTEIWRSSSAGIFATRFRTFLDAVGFTKISRTNATLSFGTVNANSSVDLTVSVTGITLTNGVAWVNPQASNLLPTGISYYCFVLTDGTITVRAINSTTSNIALPASGSYIVYALVIS